MNKKQLVQQIKRLAIGDPPIDTGTPSAPGGQPPTDFMGPTQQGPAKPRPTGVGSGSSRNVQQLQSALINLARSVIKEMNTSALQAPNGQPGAAQQEAGGRTSFSDFIAQHYMRQSDVPGVEFSPDPKKTNLKEKDPTQTTRMNVVMDTMQRVGGASSELKVDGQWGPRTNAALHNAYAYAYALLKMSKDFGYTPKSFDERRLQEMQQLLDHIPLGQEASVSAKEKDQLAGEIAPYVKTIGVLFEEVKRHILQKPAYRSYIEGSQAYATYKSRQIDPQVLADLNRKFTNMRIVQPAQPGVAQVVRPISVRDLMSVQALQAWQRSNMPNMPLPNILQQIKQHLDDTDVSRGQL